MDKEIVEYVKFIQEQIQKHKDSSQLINNNEITPAVINRALGEYSTVNLALIAEYNRLKAESFSMDLDYTKWWDDLFVKVRQNMIAETESKTIKIAVKEIEATVRNKNSEKYQEWQNKKFVQEGKVRFMIRLLDNWKKVDNVLVNISLNMRSEMKSLSLESRINQNRDRVRTEFPKTREPV